MYNTDPNFGLHIEKKKEAENRGSAYGKIPYNHHDLVISSEMSLDPPATKRSILPMDSYGGQPLLNHGYRLLSTASSSLINQGTLWVRELRSIFEEFELNQSLYEHVLLSHLQSCKLPRCHKQAGCYISPGHHVADTKLQILVRFSSNFVAIFTLCSSAVRLKRMGNFEWIERVIPLLVLSLTFKSK